MHDFTSPDSLDKLSGPTVFLAGGITACEDWQSCVIEDLGESPELDDVTFSVMNPRRLKFDINDPKAAPQQIAWEWLALRRADIHAFWFPACNPTETVQPIALFELGRWSTLATALVVGTDPSYPRRNDVVQQLRHERPGIGVYNDFDVWVNALTQKILAARDRRNKFGL